MISIMSYQSSYKPTYGTETLEERRKTIYNPDNKEVAARYGPNAWKWMWLADDNIAFQPPEECLKAVRVHFQALEFVRDKTYEICMEAVRHHGYAFTYVPSKMRTYEMALIAAHNGAGYEVLNCCYSQTHELVLACVKNDYRAIKLVDREFMTIELCHAAVSNDYRAFNCISEDFFNRLLTDPCVEDKILFFHLISSCDQRKTTPNSYEKCGFPSDEKSKFYSIAHYKYYMSKIPTTSTSQEMEHSPKRVHLTS